MRKATLSIRSMAALGLSILAIASATAKNRKSAEPTLPSDPAASGSRPISGYDGSRDPAKDLQAAIAEATRTKRRILLEVGGDWCMYCNIMDTTFQTHPQLRKVRDTYYVSVKVNYSKDSPNDEFLSHYPRVIDYPHFFVLDSKGTLLHSQPTHGFEHGKAYNVGKIDGFLKRWGQPEKHFLNVIG
jgi:thiol:disulfide interchange protein